MCPEKAAMLRRISRWSPTPVDRAMSITTMPKATAAMAIFSTGEEIRRSCRSFLYIRLDIRYPRFTILKPHIMKHKGIIKLFCAAIFGVFCLSLATSCAEKKPQGIVVGAENFDAYLPLLEGKRVGFVGNNTSVRSDGTHVVDFLQEKGVNVVKAFGPEHGFQILPFR